MKATAEILSTTEYRVDGMYDSQFPFLPLSLAPQWKWIRQSVHAPSSSVLLVLLLSSLMSPFPQSACPNPCSSLSLHLGIEGWKKRKAMSLKLWVTLRNGKLEPHHYGCCWFKLQLPFIFFFRDAAEGENDKESTAGRNPCPLLYRLRASWLTVRVYVESRHLSPRPSHRPQPQAILLRSNSYRQVSLISRQKKKIKNSTS